LHGRSDRLWIVLHLLKANVNAESLSTISTQETLNASTLVMPNSKPFDICGMTENAVRDRYFFHDYILSYLLPQSETELYSPNMLAFHTAKTVIWAFTSPLVLRKTNRVLAVSTLRKNFVDSVIDSTDLAFLSLRNL
jgi:hypothetical protein